MKQKKKVIIIFLIILTILTISRLIEYYPIYVGIIQENNVNGNGKVIWTLIWLVGSVFAGIISSIIPGVIIGMIYRVYSNGGKVSKKESSKRKIGILDLGEYEGYYRDIISEYSPAVLSFIDDFESNAQKDRAATLLNLKLKEYIDIKNKKIEILNKDFSKLTESEKYLLENRESGKFNGSEFENRVKQEAIEAGLITSRKFGLDSYMKIILPFIVAILLFMFISEINVNMPFQTSLVPVVMLLVCLFFGSLFLIYNLNYVVTFLKYGYTRTKKGREINKKLQGLKNYLKDFSNLDKKSFNDVILWEDYLMYSVIFDQNKKIIDEILDE